MYKKDDHSVWINNALKRSLEKLKLIRVLKKHYFHFISNYRHISLRFLLLSSSLHIPYVRPISQIGLYRSWVFHSLEHIILVSKLCKYAIWRIMTLTALERNFNCLHCSLLECNRVHCVDTRKIRVDVIKTRIGCRALSDRAVYLCEGFTDYAEKY